MAVGMINLPPRPGGHAWVVVQRGDWYLLETTVTPDLSKPWQRVSDLTELYMPEAFINDYGVFCSMSSDICKQYEHIEVKGLCPCRY
jgi:hypothetical protein